MTWHVHDVPCPWRDVFTTWHVHEMMCPWLDLFVACCSSAWRTAAGWRAGSTTATRWATCSATWRAPSPPTSCRRSRSTPPSPAPSSATRACRWPRATCSTPRCCRGSSDSPQDSQRPLPLARKPQTPEVDFGIWSNKNSSDDKLHGLITGFDFCESTVGIMVLSLIFNSM